VEEIIKEVDKIDEKLRQTALRIHEKPELGFNEYTAVQILTDLLVSEGYTIETNIAGLDTAFIATYTNGEEGPTIGLLAEYDALPNLGHGCGHNLIGTASVGAAIALKNSHKNLPGTIKVIGTPAEEGGGGKIAMADQGVFNDLDVAMMCHPKNKTMVLRGGLACQGLTFKFYGKESHASSAPEEGISALDAMLNSFTAINSLREYFTDEVRIHGIIQNGGEAPNIVPSYCESEFLIRAKDRQSLQVVKEKVVNAVNNSAKGVGAEVKTDEDLVYAERNNNATLAKVFKKHMEFLGSKVSPPPKRGGLGSSDIGNVGEIVPTIHPYFKIGEHVNHTKGFVEDAKSEQGLEGMNKATKSLAMTAYELCVDDKLLTKIKKEFEASKKGGNINDK